MRLLLLDPPGLNITSVAQTKASRGTDGDERKVEQAQKKPCEVNSQNKKRGGLVIPLSGETQFKKLLILRHGHGPPAIAPLTLLKVQVTPVQLE